MEGKVLQIINSSGLGGAETIVQELLEREKYPVFCLKEDEIERFRAVSDEVYFGTKTRYYKQNPFVLFKLLNLIKQKKIEVMHVHLGTSLFYAILVKILIPHMKLIYHEHGEIFYNNKLKILIKTFHNKIDMYIAVSKVTKKKLVEDTGTPEDKITILYNFVNLNRLKEDKIKHNLQVREQIKVEQNDFVIGYVGRLNKIKGCEYLIRALQYLDMNYTCLILGDGELKKELEKLSYKLDVAENVVFLGYKQDIDAYYSLFDTLVMPSLSEASPMTFYESQAYGIPIIGSDIPAIKELVSHGKNGLLFNVEDSKDLASKIIFVYNNKDIRVKMKKYSLENVEKYSLDNYMKKLSEIYVDLSKN
jgi:glycosyltransferase involved in cell wall biosynthesis